MQSIQELTMQELTMQELTMQELTMQELTTPPPMYRLDYLETSKRCSEDEPPPYISPPPYTIQSQQLQLHAHELQLHAHELQLHAHELQLYTQWVKAQRVQVQRVQAQAERVQTQSQRVQAQVQRLQVRKKPNPFGCCYRKPVKDARCCGACYTFCYQANKEPRLECCPSTCGEYCVSGYIITTSGGVYEDDVCCCTFICLPCKIVMFFPCFLGASFNHLINCCRNTQTNYLF